MAEISASAPKKHIGWSLVLGAPESERFRIPLSGKAALGRYLHIPTLRSYLYPATLGVNSKHDVVLWKCPLDDALKFSLQWDIARESYGLQHIIQGISGRFALVSHVLCCPHPVRTAQRSLFGPNVVLFVFCFWSCWTAGTIRHVDRNKLFLKSHAWDGLFTTLPVSTTHFES